MSPVGQIGVDLFKKGGPVSECEKRNTWIAERTNSSPHQTKMKAVSGTLIKILGVV